MRKIVLNSLLIISFLLSPNLFLNSYARANLSANTQNDLDIIENLYFANTLIPLDEEMTKNFLDKVHTHQSLLKSQGKNQILQEYVKLRNLQIIRDRLTKCLGADPLSQDLKEKLLAGAQSASANSLTDCLSSNQDLLSATSALEEISKKLSEQDKFTKTKELDKKLFESTIMAASDKYTEISYLISEGLSQDSTSSKAFCASGSCSKELIAKLESEEKIMRDRLKSQGIKPIQVSEEAKKIQAQMKQAYASIYSKTDFTRSDLGQAAGKYGKELKAPAEPPAKEYKEWKASAAEQEGAEFKRIRDDLIENNSVVRILRTSGYKDLNATLYMGDPQIIRDPYDNISANPWEQTYKNKLIVQRTTPVNDIGTEISSINEKNILAARDHSLKTLAAGISDLIKDQKETGKNIEDHQKSIKKMIAMNSFGAGQLLLQDPSMVELFCDGIQSLAKDEHDRQWWDNASQVAMLLSLPAGGFGFVTMTGVRGAAFAATAARGLMIGASVGEVGGLGYSTTQEIRKYRESKTEQSTCWIQGQMEKACEDARKKEKSAVQSLVVNGVALTTLGGVAKTAQVGLRRSLLVESESLITKLGSNSIKNMGDELFSVYATRLDLAKAAGDKDAIKAIEEEIEIIRKLDTDQLKKLRQEFETRKAGEMCQI